MRRPRYALEPVVGLRRTRADEAASALASAVAAREASERERALAEQQRQSHDTRSEEQRDRERRALEQGQLSAADLARGGAWEIRVAAERSALTRAVDEKVAAEHDAHRAEDRGRGDLSAREADAAVIEKDRARWQEQQRQSAQAKEEEEAADAYRPAR